MRYTIVFMSLMYSLSVPHLSCIRWAHLKDPTSLFLLLFFHRLSLHLFFCIIYLELIGVCVYLHS